MSRAGDGDGGEGGLGVYKHLTQVGFAHNKGKGGGGAWAGWPQVSCFQGSRFGFQGLGFRVQVWGLSFRV